MSKIVINNDCLTIINSSKRFSKIFCNYCESKLKIYTNDQIKHHLDTIKHKNNSEILKKKEEKQVFIEIESSNQNIFNFKNIVEELNKIVNEKIKNKVELITEDFKVIENKMTEIINILNNNSLKTKKQINTEKNQKIIPNSTDKTKANKISSKKNIIKKLINLPEITKESDNLIEKSMNEENINLYIDLKSDENISQNNDTIQKININNDFNNIKSLILDNLIENKPPNNIINQRKNQFYNLFPDISEEKIVKQEFQDNDINLNIVKGERINLTDLIPNIEISSILTKKKRRIDLPIDYILIQEEKIKKRKGKSIFNENEELPSKRQKKEIKI